MSRSFLTIGYGGTADDAFAAAVREARHWHGHRGHTGTIAEKAHFVAIGPVPDDVDVVELYRAFCRAVITDHWSPQLQQYVPDPPTVAQAQLADILSCEASGLNALFHHIWSPALCFEVLDDDRGRRWAFMGTAGSSSSPIEPAMPTQCDIRGRTGVAVHRYRSQPFGREAVVRTCHAHELARWEPVNPAPDDWMNA